MLILCLCYHQKELLEKENDFLRWDAERQQKENELQQQKKEIRRKEDKIKQRDGVIEEKDLQLIKMDEELKKFQVKQSVLTPGISMIHLASLENLGVDWGSG